MNDININNNPLVSIVCTAYNHEPYIRQCLEGFVMQKTNFLFEVLINDDASTDNTASIIREYETKYPDIIKPIYQAENQYSKRVGLWRTILFPRAKGKYIALCEGDDYWTDQYKLQKQVDFLEANEDFVVCSHRYKIFNVETKKWNSNKADYLFNQNIKGIEFGTEAGINRYELTKTVTVMFRRKCLDLNTLSKYKYSRDVHFFYHLLNAGKGYCMNYDAAVYRHHKGGVWGLNSKLEKLSVNAKVFEELYRNNPKDTALKYQYYSLLFLLKTELYFGVISFKYPFFDFKQFKKFNKIYSDNTKKSLFIYPISCVFYVKKRLKLSVYPIFGKSMFIKKRN